MKSPFPGMDPYIEACGLWEDFHKKLIGDLERTLAALVPDRYSVRLGERSYVVLANADGKETSPFHPDVGVTSRAEREPATSQDTATAVAEPTTDAQGVSMRAYIEEEYRESFIEVYEADPEQRLVTCLEVLSPSNKRRGTPGWELYLRKRQALLLHTANFIEIDLLRGGQRMPMHDPWPKSPYVLLVARRERTPYCRVWSGHYHKPLPVLPVPLTRPDPDVSLPLQPLIEAVYTRSHYERDIDYTRPLTPPLSPDESAWLEQQLKARQPSNPSP
jgi:hypothetical protein